MRSIAVFFDDPAPDGYPLSNEEYGKSYKDFAVHLRSRGARFFVVRGAETYRGANRFASGWEYQPNGTLIRCDQPFSVDIIYNKGHLATDPQAIVLNDPKLDALCTNKMRTFELVPEISPRTSIVQNEPAFDGALKEMSTKRVVAKPVDGEGGEGVYIGSKAEVRKLVTRFPYLLQEYVDTAGGIPGIVQGSHDFRLVSVRGKLVQAFVRTPPPGGILPNVAQGGSTTDVPLDRIPAPALDAFSLVDRRLEKFANRVYSVDLGLGHDGQWKLFELNSRPALFGCERGAGFVRFHEALATVLLTAKK